MIACRVGRTRVGVALMAAYHEVMELEGVAMTETIQVGVTVVVHEGVAMMRGRRLY